MGKNGSERKIKIARVVTAPESVEFHLKNMLDLQGDEFEVEVIGTDVSQFKDRWPTVKWTNLEISRKINILNDIKALIKLTVYLSFHRFDIVHSIMPKAGLLTALSAFVTKVPIRLHTFTGQTWANKVGASRRVFVFIDWLTARLCTKCYTDSRSQSQYLFEHGIKKNNRPLGVLADGSLSGVNLDRFNKIFRFSKRSEMRLKYGIPETALVFTFIGRKCKDKGIYELMKAFGHVSKKLPESFLLLVGPDDDQLFKEVLNSQTKLQKNIINVGLSSHPEEYLAATDIFCLPSHREGFGSVIIEAAAMEIPAIGTRIPGLVDAIIDGKTGILVPKNNAEELASAMIFLGSDPNLTKELGLHAKQRAIDQFSSERLFDALKTEYSSLVNIVIP